LNLGRAMEIVTNVKAGIKSLLFIFLHTDHSWRRRREGMLLEIYGRCNCLNYAMNKQTSNEAPHYVVFSSLLPLPPS
jgi:hypothetical protein